MKKAQGMPLNVIIIAALVLMVLVILSVIFIGRTRVFITEATKCQNNGGTCVDRTSQCEDEFQQIASNYYCDNSENGKFDGTSKDGYCCISVTTNNE